MWMSREEITHRLAVGTLECRRGGRGGQRAQKGAMTRDMEDSDGGCMDYSTSDILKRGQALS